MRWSWICIISLVCTAGSVAAMETAWNPTRTWVFAVGVLNFDTKGLATWPDEGRVDAKMIDVYRARGVPAEQIVFLKNNEATNAQVQRRLVELLNRTQTNDTFIFYFAGHGGRDYRSKNRTCSLVCYDVLNSWPVSSIFDSIEKHFKGSRVILTADCCHSGGLATEASQRKSKLAYGVLTSAHVSSKSTGNWTFTQCLVDVLSGTPVSDYDWDGTITFSEAARYCEAEMAFGEGQISSSTTAGGFSDSFTLGKTTGVKLPRIGDHIEGEDKGKWWPAKVLESKDGKCFVTWYGWDKKYDCWLEPQRMRAAEKKTIDIGTKGVVEWDGQTYPATVIGEKLGLNFIHYDGYPDSDDEWIRPSRFKQK